MGIDVAIEEQDGHKAKETIIALKTALMGSLAGVGDSLFHVIWGRFLVQLPERLLKMVRLLVVSSGLLPILRFCLAGQLFTARDTSKESN